MKIDWKRKLTSRKFWSAVVGFVTPLLLAFSVPSETATQVTSIIMSSGALIAYIIGEGIADSGNSSFVELDEIETDDDYDTKNDDLKG